MGAAAERRTFAGFGLLLAGFVVQIGGYVVDERSAWLALFAAAVAVAGVVAGRLVADPGAHRRAVPPGARLPRAAQGRVVIACGRAQRARWLHPSVHPSSGQKRRFAGVF